MNKKILAMCMLLCLLVTISLCSSRENEYFGFR